MKEERDPSQSEAVASENRCEPRRSVEVPVRVTFDDGVLDGFTENLSRAGILCFLDSAPRVTVEWNEGDGSKTRVGRIVRVNRMGSDRTGLAIEFEANGSGEGSERPR